MTLGRRVLIVASAMVLALGLPSLTRAQSLTGSISGTVADAQGGMLPGADVTLTNQDSKTVQRTVTNSEGVFVFAVGPRRHLLASRVELSGFTAWEATDIVMLLGQRRTVTGITLKVGGLDEVISVTSRPEIAPVDSGEKSARLTSEQIQNVPMVGRSTGELLKLLPGMTPISGSTSNSPGFNGEVIGINGNGDGGKQSAVGNFSGNGTRADALDIVIDGAHASDPGCNCATSVNPNPDMVGEFKVLQSNYGAEHAKGPITIDVDQQGRRPRLPRHGLHLSARLPLELQRVAPEQVQHRARRREQAEEQVRVSRLQPRRPAGDSRARASTRTATRSSSSPATSSTSSGSTPASCSRGCRPTRCCNGDFSQHVVVLGPQQLVRQHDARTTWSTAASRPTRSIRTASGCCVCCRGRTPTRR